MKNYLLYISIFTLVLCIRTAAQVYPDQNYVLLIDSIKTKVELSENVELSKDGKAVVLKPNTTEGYFILKEQNSAFPFNQGLPSYNGSAPDENCGFKVQMRFPYSGSWSPWLTIGYWKNNIWPDYGTTSYAGGKINVDWAVLNSYVTKWQYKVILSRTDISKPSPTIYKLSFFVSDSKTTSSVNLSQIVNDNPAELFISTQHIFQNSIDPTYGGDMCSPTSVSMILKSYNIAVDPFKFAWATYDNYHKMFGIWPRVVQNAAEYGLDGAVTRYRTWSETRKVLEKGGRIAMSVGVPISSVGHLLMLAGFTNDGRVIVHDPGKSSGFSYMYDKYVLSQAWFTKGGIAYTFFPNGTTVSVPKPNETIAADFELYQNYPNPFNPTTDIRYKVQVPSYVTLKVYDMLGGEVATLVDEYKQPGNYNITFNVKTPYQPRQDGVLTGMASLPSGVYFYRLTALNPSAGKEQVFTQTKKMILAK